MAIGAEGTNPNISTFGADQFDDFNPNEKELKALFFNWWMFISFLGASIATLGLGAFKRIWGGDLGMGSPLLVFYCLWSFSV